MKDNTVYNESMMLLTQGEEHYQFQYPDLLKQFLAENNSNEYSYYDGVEEYSIADFLIPGTTGLFESIMDEKLENGFLPDVFIPFARDWGDDLFCFNNYDLKIYLFYPTDEEPDVICENVECFLNHLRINI